VTEFVFVLGMGRSGTSALTRLLALCGASLPPNLLGGTDYNPTGHWEPLDALGLNERFLNARNSDWFDPSLRVQTAAGQGNGHEAFVSEIVGFLEQCPGSATVIIKEPRITALTAYWFEATGRRGEVPRIVIAVRHPTEVAASLAARDGISVSLSNALWLKYNLLAERASRSFRRVFVDYGRLLADWHHEMGRVATALGIRLVPSLAAEAATFLRSDLRHHIADGGLVESFGQRWIANVYEALLAASRDLPFDARSLDTSYAAFVDGTIDIRAAICEFDTRRSGGWMRASGPGGC